LIQPRRTPLEDANFFFFIFKQLYGKPKWLFALEIVMLKLINLFLIVSFVYAGCATTTAQPTKIKNHFSPMAQSTSCQEGITRHGFISQSTAGNTPCTEGTQICLSGEWLGPMLYDSCENYTKNCDESPHGSVVTGYLQPSSTKGVPCTLATKTCLNGSWVGPEVFTSCSEL
jgi:hypothetical protein